MKTKVLLLALLSGFVFSATAQEFQPQVGFSTETGRNADFKKNKAKDNWFISIGGGVSVLMGDQNSSAKFGDRLNFAPQLSFGKWFSPYLGFRTQINGGVLNGYAYPNFDTSKQPIKRENKYLAGHVDLLWDVTNYWAPYKESKVFRLIPWVGIGYAHRFNTIDAVDFGPSNTPTVNAGLLMAFRVSKRVDINLEGQFALTNAHFSGIVNQEKADGIAQVGAGLTFKLGKTDFEVIQPMDYALLNDLNNQINSLRAENDELSKRPVSCPPATETVVNNVVNNYANNVVYFRLNSAKVDKNQQINIYNTADYMKKNEVAIKVIGYADKNTGSGTYNLGLSEKRAKAVAKELVDKYGISSSQITIEWKGSDVQPYGENNWNRVVVMTAEK